MGGRILVVVMAVTWLGCLPGPEPPGQKPGCVIATPVTVSNFVVNSIHFPRSASEATEVGANIDGDDLGRVDNALAQVLAAIAGAAGDFDLDSSTAELIDAGEILHLLQIHRSASDGCAVVTVRHVIDQDGDPSDNFSGVEPFDIDPTRGAGALGGSVMTVTSGAVSIDVSGGTAPIAVTFFGRGEPYVVDLAAPIIRATYSSDGLAGVLAGAIVDPETNLYPVLYEGVLRSVEGDCPGGVCVPDSFGAAALEYLDSNNDGQISFDEFRNANLVKSLLVPDLDLVDADGNRCPRCDGIKDSLSVGLGFTAVSTGPIAQP